MTERKRTDWLEQTPYGIWHYDSGMYNDSPEEIERLNNEYYKKQEEAIPQILEDGFIEFPILFESFGEEIWSSCYLPPSFVPSNTPGFKEKHGMGFNIYIPSYKRAETSYTAKTLEEFGIENYYICIDPDQYEDYKKYHKQEHLIIRDASFKSDRKLDLISSVQCPDYLHGASGVFNSLLYISKSIGEEIYFTMDDDFYNFGIKARKGNERATGDEKYDKNNYYRATRLTPELFDLKDFLNDMGEVFQKIRNVSMMSLDKFGLKFIFPLLDFTTGTRSYSCYLSRTSTQHDHLGQQNNDIITSLEMAKEGYVNVILEGISYNSMDTQADEGGASSVYKRFGTLDKSKCLVQAQPNWSKISHVYNRIHHKVDFSGYNKMRLVPETTDQDNRL